MSIRKGSVYIAGNNISIDGDTISYNSNNSLQSLGNINKNVAVGSVDKLFDWVGTNADYIAQDIETLHPEWICYITDDQGTGVGAVYNTAQADARFFKKNDDTDSTTISGLGMPNTNRYETITVLASDSDYVAPANGYFFGQATATGVGGNIRFQYPNSEISGYMRVICWATSAGNYNLYVMCPVKKDESIKFGYANCSNQMIWFVYAEGNPTNP